MNLGANVAYASWPQFFRVTAFRSVENGFEEVGSYPLECPSVGDVGFTWLKNQLVALNLLTRIESLSCKFETYHGRAISVGDAVSGRKFLLLMPA